MTSGLSSLGRLPAALTLLLVLGQQTNLAGALFLTIVPPKVIVGVDLVQSIRCKTGAVQERPVFAIQLYNADTDRTVAYIGSLAINGGYEFKEASLVDKDMVGRAEAKGSILSPGLSFLELTILEISTCCRIQRYGCMIFFDDGSHFVNTTAKAEYGSPEKSTVTVVRSGEASNSVAAHVKAITSGAGNRRQLLWPVLLLSTLTLCLVWSA